MANAINSLKYESGTYTFTLPYAECSTANATAAKTVTVPNFALETGARIAIKFKVTNTATSPTLNVNTTGAKPIYYRGSAISAGYLAANRTYEFIYNGDQWDLIGDINTDTNTTYSGGTGISLSGTTINHKNSVTAGTAQGDASKTLSFGGTFTIPTVTYDAQGHITGKSTTTMTMPANPNVDTKVTNTLATTTKAYVTGTTSNSTNTGTQVFDTGVYLDTTAGKLTATTFNGKLTGNADTATDAQNASNLYVSDNTGYDGYLSIALLDVSPTTSAVVTPITKDTDLSYNSNLGELFTPYIRTTSGGTYDLGPACAKSISDSSGANAIGTGTNLVTERDVYYGLPKINGNHTYNSNTSIYAPTSAGTSGYILKSNGSGAPTWVNTSTLGISVTSRPYDLIFGTSTTQACDYVWSTTNVNSTNLNKSYITIKLLDGTYNLSYLGNITSRTYDTIIIEGNGNGTMLTGVFSKNKISKVIIKDAMLLDSFSIEDTLNGGDVLIHNCTLHTLNFFGLYNVTISDSKINYDSKSCAYLDSTNNVMIHDCIFNLEFYTTTKDTTYYDCLQFIKYCDNVKLSNNIINIINISFNVGVNINMFDTIKQLDLIGNTFNCGNLETTKLSYLHLYCNRSGDIMRVNINNNTFYRFNYFSETSSKNSSGKTLVNICNNKILLNDTGSIVSIIADTLTFNNNYVAEYDITGLTEYGGGANMPCSDIQIYKQNSSTDNFRQSVIINGNNMLPIESITCYYHNVILTNNIMYKTKLNSTSSYKIIADNNVAISST